MTTNYNFIISAFTRYKVGQTISFDVAKHNKTENSPALPSKEQGRALLITIRGRTAPVIQALTEGIVTAARKRGQINFTIEQLRTDNSPRRWSVSENALREYRGKGYYYYPSASTGDQLQAPPFFEVPEFCGMFAPKTQQAFIDSKNMTRHFLIMGETGSGKTLSAVMPLLRSAVNYEVCGMWAAILLIDPKNHELRNYVEILPGAAGRIVDLDKNSILIDFFEGERELSLDARIEKLLAASPNCEASGHTSYNGDWTVKSKQFFSDVIKLDNAIRRKTNNRQNLWKTTGLSSSSQRKSYFEHFSDFVAISRNGPKNLFGLYSDISKRFGSDEVILRKADFLVHHVNRDYNGNAQANQHLYEQHIYITDGVIPIIADFTNQDVNDHICMDPFVRHPKCANIRDFIMDQKIVIYSPNVESQAEAFIGSTLKTKFFKFTFKTFEIEKRNWPVFYVCDEFQRYITSDTESGEQSYLDRCRAFNAICVLSTQSLSSLYYAVYSRNANVSAARESVDIMLINTGNQLYFRSTDYSLQLKLKGLLPAPPRSGFPHVLDTRPLTSLKTGECYFILTNAQWGRHKIQCANLASPATMPAVGGLNQGGVTPL